MTSTPENAPCWHNQYHPREISQFCSTDDSGTGSRAWGGSQKTEVPNKVGPPNKGGTPIPSAQRSKQATNS